MNLLDMRTVVLSFSISNLLCIAVMGILWRHNHRRFAGLGFWMTDFVMQFIALALIVLRGVVPDILSMTGSNTLVMGGTILLYIGLERFVDKHGPQLHNYILLAAFVVVHAYFVFAQPSLSARNITISLGLLAVCSQAAWLMLGRVNPDMRRITRGVGHVLVGFCLTSMARVIIDLIVPMGDDLFQSDVYNTLLLMTYQMLFIALTFSLFLMVNHRLVADLENDVAARKRTDAALRLSEEKFSKAFHSSPDAILISRLRDGGFIEVNDGFCRLTGYTREEALAGSTISLGLWPRMQERERFVAELLRNHSIRDQEFDFRTRSGQILKCLYSGEIITLRGETQVLSVVRDISERKRAEEIIQFRLGLLEYAESHTLNELMQKALDEIGEMIGSPIGFYHFVEEDQKTLSLQAWSTRTVQEFCNAQGSGMQYNISEAGVWVDCVLTKEPVIHNNYAALPHRKGLPAGHAEIVRQLVVPILKEGRVVSILGVGNKLSEYDEQDVKLVKYAADIVWRIIERKRVDEEIRQLNTLLEHMAMTDDLTGLHNRRSFFNRCREELKRVQRHPAPFSLLMLDIDHFKRINDTYGHEAGDTMLQDLAGALQRNIREIDLLARLGGEEFGILLPDTKTEDAVRLAERMRQAVEELTCTSGERNMRVTVSIGISTFRKEMQNFEDVLKNADTALYQAKSQGRNRIVALG